MQTGPLGLELVAIGTDPARLEAFATSPRCSP